MKKLCLNLSVALFTLGLGIFSGSAWTEYLFANNKLDAEFLSRYSETDQRLANALNRLYSQNIVQSIKEEKIARKRFERVVTNRETTIGNLRAQLPDSQNAEKAEELSRAIQELESEAAKQKPEVFLKNQPQSAEQVKNQIASDIENSNAQCLTNNYSQARCNQMKEKAISDIENKFLK